ncbi:MAG: DNA repair protein RecO [Dolichospermum sp.]|jgi:DNA repair protein RecO (recombination protein O)|uniref:DNA repair protein RecO n=1 Tax=Dolichospermum circinale TaxID=109265 RepID=UPI00041AA115|nr:DNA repair protein RecO [Dolichospermum circinale]MDB9481164.1 DNA repair protein RecO [Dolichospermum circinale CS-537/05]MDB9456099.1 DNA repair protein RecO [Dolichospermum circinale CS-541/06]MDB9463343.1 DNA repair protein RecO [Dolichospermum circinale CS-541/04]MDB9476480.1 DNA repair protein RecO [Dolichospermum circinale CS-537/11]MDB9480924.1 DNA repair protein RecO [Dolichospermum circinale CS-537/03]
MSKTYKATGINLKTQPLGESDKIVTILTQEFGLIRAVATGARKQNSSLGGKMGMFVINELLISPGKNLDIIIEAQTIKNYPGLSKNLGKLAASQYLAEIVLCQSLSEQPQIEIYELFNKYIQRIEDIPRTETKCVIAFLVQGVFQLLDLAGLRPQVEFCCLTQRFLTPDWKNPHWQVGFSIPSGGIICLEAWKNLQQQIEQGKWEDRKMNGKTKTNVPNTQSLASDPSDKTVFYQQELPIVSYLLNGKELFMLQHLSEIEIIQIDAADYSGWLAVEQVLRQYVQYHLGQVIHSATLIDSYFATNHDAIV